MFENYPNETYFENICFNTNRPILVGFRKLWVSANCVFAGKVVACGEFSMG